MRHSHHMVRPRSSECGSAMIEAVICMLLICLILFGLLQVFYSAAAQMVTDYSAFRAGVKVRHPKFGDGLIVSTRGEGSALIANISFPGLGIKALSVQIAPLTIIQ